MTTNPHDSFAPVRLNQKCKWFSTSADYMRSVYNAITNAKEEIFITDWWLSPEVYLKRPIEHIEDRLDKILIKKSQENVHVYILIYNEFGLFLNLKSLRTEQVLTDYGRNKFIHVIRHPYSHHTFNEIVWTHHEKSVIIDQTLAFIGGIDLCFGRWDDHSYKIVDLGNRENKVDVCADIEDDYVIIEPHDVEQVEQKKVANRGVIADIIMGKYINHKENGNLARREVGEKPVNEHQYTWIGKDYANTYRQDFKNVEFFEEDQFDRTKIPRMPWRDQGLVMFGECVRDLVCHFTTRWQHAKGVKIAIKDGAVIIPDWFVEDCYTADLQLLRSLDYWSGGLTKCETSIMNAYVELINKAEHYIYIENQYFVTTCDSVADTDVKNTIGAALVSRIKRAHEEKKKFRVYVVMPLLPGFDSIDAIRAVQFYNMRSINRGEYSIHQALLNAGITEPNEYITFHCMKTWSVLMGKLVSEIIYIHSKLMIVDDKYVICGSANINDRSMLGSRDSELAVLITDKEFTKSKLDGVEMNVGKYAHELRMKIFSVHLGNTESIDVTDCVCDEFYAHFRNRSTRNTSAYNKVFKYQPSDEMLILNDLKNYFIAPYEQNKDLKPEDAKKLLENEILGFLIDFPLKFLLDEKHFYPEWDTIDGLIPKIIWTFTSDLK